VSQFVAEDINPHGFGEQEENNAPTGRPGEERNPSGIRPTTDAYDRTKGQGRAGANRQQQDCDEELKPLEHAAKIKGRNFGLCTFNFLLKLAA